MTVPADHRFVVLNKDFNVIGRFHEFNRAAYWLRHMGPTCFIHDTYLREFFDVDGNITQRTPENWEL